MVAQVEDGVELVILIPILLGQIDTVCVEYCHIARGVLLLVGEELLQFFLSADDDGVARRTEVVADIGCHIVCPGLDICRDENLAALSGKGDRDDEVLASLQVVCLVELAALLGLIVRQFSVFTIPRVVVGIEGEMLATEVDGTDLRSVLVGCNGYIVIWLHHGIIASHLGIRRLSVHVLVIMDGLLAEKGFDGGGIDGSGFAVCGLGITVYLGFEFILCRRCQHVLPLYTVASLHDDGDETALVLQEEGNSLVFLVGDELSLRHPLLVGCIPLLVGAVVIFIEFIHRLFLLQQRLIAETQKAVLQEPVCLGGLVFRQFLRARHCLEAILIDVILPIERAAVGFQYTILGTGRGAVDARAFRSLSILLLHGDAEGIVLVHRLVGCQKVRVGGGCPRRGSACHAGQLGGEADCLALQVGGIAVEPVAEGVLATGGGEEQQGCHPYI